MNCQHVVIIKVDWLFGFVIVPKFPTGNAAPSLQLGQTDPKAPPRPPSEAGGEVGPLVQVLKPRPRDLN